MASFFEAGSVPKGAGKVKKLIPAESGLKQPHPAQPTGRASTTQRDAPGFAKKR
jgi:hypothetical protein